MSTLNIFFYGDIENILHMICTTFLLKNAPCPELWSTFNIKTARLLRPLLGSTKSGLTSRIVLYLISLQQYT